ncbi:hypothetical protein J5N97_012727 [Dioscorea zingiberensis]|uniref:UPF3 domain-containing protein n=1 Tax=Dioscorea zingiberensis TaxID=325984 RepID=A0A9D5HI46_9LILI|nr:hypothetical protein J5N97_012727 [Dioscorea zingiberensis]
MKVSLKEGMHMKDPLGRTKAVLRHLPPAISQSALMDQIDARFAGRYKWATFRPGKTSHKSQRYSRAYIDFTSPEDVVEFAEYFDGHIFVNEKGAQFKVLVEYAPSQRAPKAWSKKDGREATILKDPEYLEFLEHLAKPIENLPSAEVQLERKEAERAGGVKEALIVTPLMDFVRQRRAAKIGSQRASVNGKLGRRVVGASVGNSSPSSKRVTEKKRVPASMYVVRDTTKPGRGKDKSAFILVPRKESKQVSGISGIASAAGGREVNEENVNGSSGATSIASGVVEIGKRPVLLKGKERETSHAGGGSLQQQNSTSSVRNAPGSTTLKRSQQHEAGGRIVRSILSNKEGRQGQLYNPTSLYEKQTQTPNLEKDKRPPWPPNTRLFSKDSNPNSSSIAPAADTEGKRHIDDKVGLNDLHGSVFTSEKNDKRMKNKDRPDRSVWARHSDISHGSEESHVYTDVLSDSLEGVSISQQGTGVTMGNDNRIQNIHVGRGNNTLATYEITLGSGEMKSDMPNSSRNLETKSAAGGRASSSPIENGSYRQVGRRGSGHGLKEADGPLNLSDVKPSKRGPSGYGYHERQVWVQKSGSAS